MLQRYVITSKQYLMTIFFLYKFTTSYMLCKGVFHAPGLLSSKQVTKAASLNMTQGDKPTPWHWQDSVLCNTWKTLTAQKTSPPLQQFSFFRLRMLCRISHRKPTRQLGTGSNDCASFCSPGIEKWIKFLVPFWRQARHETQTGASGFFIGANHCTLSCTLMCRMASERITFCPERYKRWNPGTMAHWLEIRARWHTDFTA